MRCGDPNIFGIQIYTLKDVYEGCVGIKETLKKSISKGQEKKSPMITQIGFESEKTNRKVIKKDISELLPDIVKLEAVGKTY
jgi:hypothetical protein